MPAASTSAEKSAFRYTGTAVSGLSPASWRATLPREARAVLVPESAAATLNSAQTVDATIVGVRMIVKCESETLSEATAAPGRPPAAASGEAALKVEADSLPPKRYPPYGESTWYLAGPSSTIVVPES